MARIDAGTFEGITAANSVFAEDGLSWCTEFGSTWVNWLDGYHGSLETAGTSGIFS